MRRHWLIHDQTGGLSAQCTIFEGLPEMHSMFAFDLAERDVRNASFVLFMVTSHGSPGAARL